MQNVTFNSYWSLKNDLASSVLRAVTEITVGRAGYFPTVMLESILSSTCCNIPVPEEAKQLQSITKPPPCFTTGMAFF